jgi:hypothetical protein
MNVHDAAHRLLENVKRSEGQDMLFEDSKLMKVAKETLDGLHERTKGKKIDCEYVAKLETANTQVAFLAGIGVLTDRFAADFAKAVADNKRVAMRMTRKARQTKLVIKEEQYVYHVALEDLPASQGLAALRVDKVQDPDDGTATPMTVLAGGTGALIEGVDTHQGAYDDLEPMGRWVTANDPFGALLSPDFHRAFWRFITGTWENQALLAAGTGLVVMGMDFMHPLLQSALLGAAGLSFARAIKNTIRDAASRGASTVGGYLAGLVGTAGAGVIGRTVYAVRVAMRRPPWYQRFLSPFTWLTERVAALIDGHEYGARLIAAGERFFTQDPMLMELLGVFINGRHAIATVVGAAFVVYYAAGFYTHQYVPSRQQFYLRINDAAVFTDKVGKEEECLDAINRNLENLWPGENPNHPWPRRRRDRVTKARFERELARCEREARDIRAERQGVNDATTDTDEREDICETVDDLVDRLGQLQEDVEALADNVSRELRTTFRVRNAEDCEAVGSVVDDVFSKLQL